MGYSCSRLASMRLDTIMDYCYKQTSIQNVYEVNGQRFMIEPSRRENSDGAVTGKVYKMLSDNRVWTISPTSFKIGGNGQLVRCPAFWKTIPFLVLTVDRMQEVYRGPTPVTEDVLFDQVKEWQKQFGPGGVNAHAGMVYPSRASVLDVDTNEVLAEWKAGAFQVW